MKYRLFRLTEMFNPKRGDSKYTKAYGVAHRGEYPVYSAAVEPLTYIDSYDYDGTYLTWNTNGFGGYISILKGRFSINGDRGILLPLRDDIDLQYAAEVLQPDLRTLAKGRLGDRGKNEFTKVSLDTIKKVEISIPIETDEPLRLDTRAQVEVADKLNRISELKSYMVAQGSELEASTLNIQTQGSFVDVEVSELFDLDQSTNSSWFTKRYVNQHPGDIPVFSASADDGLVGYGHIADNLPMVKYFNDILTWNIDGSVGKAIFREGRFSLSEKVIPLIPKSEWLGKIDLQYIKYELEKRAAERGFGYTNKAGKTRISDIEIPIPLDKSGNANLDIQTAIANKYKKTYELKDNIISQLRDITSLSVSLR